MAYSKEIPIYKNQIINTIISDFNTIRLLDDNYVDLTTKTVKPNVGELNYKKIFPYYYKPSVNTEKISFIIMKIDTPKIVDHLIKKMLITITVVTHQDMMKVSSGIGNRVDQMGACIDSLFNGRTDIGFGKLLLDSTREVSVDDVYRGRESTFIVDEFNQTGGNL